MRTASGRLWLAATGAAVLAAGAWIAFRLWPRTIEVPLGAALTPVVEFQDGVASVSTPERALVADVAIFDDELFAYMMFSYLRGLVARDGHRAWLNYIRQDNALAYVVRVGLPSDYIAGLAYLYRLQQVAGIEETAHRWVTHDTIARYQAQSGIFDQAYNLPARKRLESLPRHRLVAYVKRFIRFKAATDPRVRRRMEPVPVPPSRPEAHRLAEDIVTVADFFGLPLDFFLGIGAMENNYMNVQGDLGNTIWKRRAEKGDVILKRGKRGVLVLNESSGVWQITRETLRYAHRLYLKDQRDYTVLPEHLRPPRKLDVNEVPPEVLTTYAGLFLRHLLDRFDGDVATAVGAYNGGPGRPNPRYEAGVRTVAEHARRVLEHAAVLQERPAAETRFLTSAR